MGIALVLMWLAVPAYVVVQILALAWTTGRTRLIAGAPLVVMVPVFGYTALALAQESNLWPLLLLFTAPVALTYVTAVAVASRLNPSPGVRL